MVAPSIACMYALNIASIRVAACDSTLSEERDSLLLRLLFLVISLIVALFPFVELERRVEENNVAFLIVTIILLMIFIIQSIYLMIQTHAHQIVGPLPPVEPYSATGSSSPSPNRNEKDLTKTATSSSTLPMKDKVVVITGANAGIGKETARQLAQLGASKVYMACRSAGRAEKAIQDLLNTKPTPSPSSPLRPDQFQFLPCDLSDFSSVREAVNILRKDYKEGKIPNEGIDCLILNAGVMMKDKVITKDGCELMMQANVLGHFLLTRLLLKEEFFNPSPSHRHRRVLHLSSCMHRMACKDGEWDVDDLQCLKIDEKTGKDRYSFFHHYGRTKLGNLFFAKELGRRFPTVTSVAIHPGMVKTDVTNNAPYIIRTTANLFSFMATGFQKTAEQGAWGTVYAAIAPSVANASTDTTATIKKSHTKNIKDEEENSKFLLSNGSYIQNCRVKETHPLTESTEDARIFWEKCEELVDLKTKIQVDESVV